MARPTSQRTVVSRLFANSPRPIYLLDASRRIIYCNDALAGWVKQPIDALLGLCCHHAVDADKPLDGLAQQLSPPPQTLDASSYRASLQIGEGPTSSRRCASFYLLSDDVDTSATLVIVDSLEADFHESDPFNADDLHQQLTAMRQHWHDAYRMDELVGDSLGIQQVRRQIRLAAQCPCRVVIRGERGSGRQHVARTIHRERSGGRRSLVPLSCQLLDDELIDVALMSFQYEQEESGTDSPTMLLLEVDQLPLDAQAKLANFLSSSPVEIETLATSQVPLTQPGDAVRPDLAHQLACLEVNLPRLSDRLDDVPLLAQWFVERSHGVEQKQVGGFTDAAMAALLQYRWPGEVAELRSTVEQAVLATTGTLIDVQHLSEKLELAADAEAVPPREDESVPLDAFLAEVETELIQRAMRQAKGNKAGAARSLQISRAKLLRRMEQLGIES